MNDRALLAIGVGILGAVLVAKAYKKYVFNPRQQTTTEPVAPQTTGDFARLDRNALPVNVSSAASTTGDFSRMDRGQDLSPPTVTTGDFARLDRANAQSVEETPNVQNTYSDYSLPYYVNGA